MSASACSCGSSRCRPCRKPLICAQAAWSQHGLANAAMKNIHSELLLYTGYCRRVVLQRSTVRAAQTADLMKQVQSDRGFGGMCIMCCRTLSTMEALGSMPKAARLRGLPSTGASSTGTALYKSCSMKAVILAQKQIDDAVCIQTAKAQPFIAAEACTASLCPERSAASLLHYKHAGSGRLYEQACNLCIDVHYAAHPGHIGQQRAESGPDGAGEGGGRIDQNEPVHQLRPLMGDCQGQDPSKGLAQHVDGPRRSLTQHFALHVCATQGKGQSAGLPVRPGIGEIHAELHAWSCS